MIPGGSFIAPATTRQQSRQKSTNTHTRNKRTKQTQALKTLRELVEVVEENRPERFLLSLPRLDSLLPQNFPDLIS